MQAVVSLLQIAPTALPETSAVRELSQLRRAFAQLVFTA